MLHFTKNAPWGFCSNPTAQRAPNSKVAPRRAVGAEKYFWPAHTFANHAPNRPLVISITCALLATLLQQWARRYLTVRSSNHATVRTSELASARSISKMQFLFPVFAGFFWFSSFGNRKTRNHKTSLNIAKLDLH